jgi:hypothetical protein
MVNIITTVVLYTVVLVTYAAHNVNIGSRLFYRDPLK